MWNIKDDISGFAVQILIICFALPKSAVLDQWTAVQNPVATLPTVQIATE